MFVQIKLEALEQHRVVFARIRNSQPSEVEIGKKEVEPGVRVTAEAQSPTKFRCSKKFEARTIFTLLLLTCIGRLLLMTN